MHQHLHRGVLVVDEGVEALLHQVLQRDPAGDERLEVHLELLHHLDDGRMVADVGDGGGRAPDHLGRVEAGAVDRIRG